MTQNRQTYVSRWVRSRYRKRSVRIGLALLILAATASLIGFGLRPSPSATHIARPTVSTTSTIPAPTGKGLIAALTKTTISYQSPGGPTTTSIAPTWHGSSLFLPVVATRYGDLEVRLPTRPNGSTTWIRSADVRLYRSAYQIVIDLGEKRLRLYRNGVLVLSAPAGVGTSLDPTPTGHFFVAAFAKAPSASWGPFVLVTSAHSNTITDWEESGDAVIAIHGPLGADQQIGTTGARISHGCVRLHDSDLVQLRAVPDGSPVNIVS